MFFDNLGEAGTSTRLRSEATPGKTSNAEWGTEYGDAVERVPTVVLAVVDSRYNGVFAKRSQFQFTIFDRRLTIGDQTISAHK
jgi:hypothetical protein